MEFGVYFPHLALFVCSYNRSPSAGYKWVMSWCLLRFLVHWMEWTWAVFDSHGCQMRLVGDFFFFLKINFRNSKRAGSLLKCVTDRSCLCFVAGVMEWALPSCMAGGDNLCTVHLFHFQWWLDGPGERENAGLIFPFLNKIHICRQGLKMMETGWREIFQAQTPALSNSHLP